MNTTRNDQYAPSMERNALNLLTGISTIAGGSINLNFGYYK